MDVDVIIVENERVVDNVFEEKKSVVEERESKGVGGINTL